MFCGATLVAMCLGSPCQAHYGQATGDTNMSTASLKMYQVSVRPAGMSDRTRAHARLLSLRHAGQGMRIDMAHLPCAYLVKVMVVEV